MAQLVARFLHTEEVISSSLVSPTMSSRRETWVCPTCGDPMRFEILDDERFLVAWSCVSCGLIRTTEPS